MRTLLRLQIIVEVLLGQGKVIDALRLATTSGSSGANPDALPARKYLEAAQRCGDPIIFYTVFAHFTERNLRLRGSPDFDATEMCDEYVEHYRTLFAGQ